MPKILIVDDESNIRRLLEQTLEDFEEKGAAILTAGNGKEALELILSHRPEIVFLDVMMPEMNGFEVCNTVKNVNGIKNIYIILLTAKGQEFDKKRGMEAGADLYVTKPFDPDFIVEKTSEILNIEL
jgi:DNA-binding response OmpR family regulator